MESSWFELRIAGSAGTRAGKERGVHVGVAIGENGRLCPVGSGNAKRFSTRREAMAYLENTTNPPMYVFEAVACGADAVANSEGRG